MKPFKRLKYRKDKRQLSWSMSRFEINFGYKFRVFHWSQNKPWFCWHQRPWDFTRSWNQIKKSY